MPGSWRDRFWLWLLLALRRTNTYGWQSLGSLEERFTLLGMTGVTIEATRPHEFATVLLLRPFAGKAWQDEVPHIARADFAPGFRFIGLDRVGSRIRPRPLRLGRIVLSLLMCVLAVALRAADVLLPPWVASTIAAGSGAVSVALLLTRLVYDRRHFLRSERDIEAAIERLSTSVPTGPEFFSVADERSGSDALWQHAVKKFAEHSAIVLTDISDATDGIEWELRFIVANHLEKLHCYLIDRSEMPEPLKALIPRLAPAGRIRAVSQLTSSIGKEILSTLAVGRNDFDRQASRAVLNRELARLPWSEDYWVGIQALDNKEFDVAADRLNAAWQAALGTEPQSLCLYPCLSLADALTIKGALWFGPREECFARRRALLMRTYSELSTEGGDADRKSDGYLLTRLLNLQTHPTLPVAGWQYRAMLSPALTTAAALHVSLFLARGTLARAEKALRSDPQSQLASRLLAHALSNAQVALKEAEFIDDTRLQISACRYGAQAALHMDMNDIARELATRALQLLEGISDPVLASEFASLLRSAGSSTGG